jgi:hypothetical protein
MKDPPSAPITNMYVDRVLYFAKDFKEKLSCIAGGAIPQKIQNDLMKDVLNFTFRQLTENFSKVKKVVFIYQSSYCVVNKYW